MQVTATATFSINMKDSGRSNGGQHQKRHRHASTDAVIAWVRDGSSFVVIDLFAFSRSLLPTTSGTATSPASSGSSTLNVRVSEGGSQSVGVSARLVPERTDASISASNSGCGKEEEDEERVEPGAAEARGESGEDVVDGAGDRGRCWISWSTWLGTPSCSTRPRDGRNELGF
ncbi:hypothetical protein B296_00019583 [Ensete ventricosum]|uniref:Uncharacterized protein n=1 Tax=Ensete ventricosum TaxID=4639 RepID=A0A427B0D4_ENSVE|nr:hypothetical protein B296_00019583 [Ensete ventricosum]